jgi:hypothetical protein
VRSARRKDAPPRAVAIRVRDSNELLSLAEDPSPKTSRAVAVPTNARAEPNVANDRVLPLIEGFSPDERPVAPAPSYERAGTMRARMVP